MIHSIGILCQDRNSFGFLVGLQRRLGCDATFVEPTGVPLKSTELTRVQARLAAKQLLSKSVDLIVRFTDADGRRWQDVRRHELQVFPADVSGILACGVAVNNVEEWLCLDPEYVSGALSISVRDIKGDPSRSDIVKRAIARQHKLNEPAFEVTAQLVANAPAESFRRWLQDDSLRHFYTDCRAYAMRANCPVNNEL